MNTLQERVAAARRAATETPAPCQEAIARPEDGFEIKGYFRKGDKEGSSWIARCVGVEPDPKNPKFKKVVIQFDEFFQEIEWKGEKGKGTPEGFKTWVLEDGLYKSKIVSKRGDKPTYQGFAVIHGERDNLSEAEMIATIESTPVLPGEEEELNAEAFN